MPNQAMVCVYEKCSLKCTISLTQQPNQAKNLQSQIEDTESAWLNDSPCSASRQPSNHTGSSIIPVPKGPKTCQFPASGCGDAMIMLTMKEIGSRIFHPILFRIQRRSGYIA